MALRCCTNFAVWFCRSVALDFIRNRSESPSGTMDLMYFPGFVLQVGEVNSALGRFIFRLKAEKGGENAEKISAVIGHGVVPGLSSGL
jgi:hypothetical protein